MEWNRTPSRVERLHRLSAILSRAYAVEAEPSVKQLCAGVTPSSDEHIVICPTCGQMFDCREKDQVDHHSNGKHAPKLFL